MIYHLPKPGLDGRTQIILSPMELLGSIAALVPPPRQHRHRYYGVLAPQLAPAPVGHRPGPRPVATAPELVAKPAVEAVADDPPPDFARSPARYLWAMLLARIYEAFPLTCPRCGAEMRIIAFITEAVDVGPSWSTSANPPPRPGSPKRDARRSGTKAPPRTPATP